MKKILIAVAIVIAGLAAWGKYVLPERLDNLPLIQLSKSRELLGYDLVSDRFAARDAGSIEAFAQTLKADKWNSRPDEPGSVSLKHQIYKWPMRYDYTIRISRPETVDPENLKKVGATKPGEYIEVWYVIDGSLQWFHKVQPGS